MIAIVAAEPTEHFTIPQQTSRDLSMIDGPACVSQKDKDAQLQLGPSSFSLVPA